MATVRFIKEDGRKMSVNTDHVLRLDEGKDEDTTVLIMTDTRVTVKGSMDEVEDRLEGRATTALENHGRAQNGKKILMEEAPPIRVREYRQPRDPSNMFADENYDQPVSTA